MTKNNHYIHQFLVFKNIYVFLSNLNFIFEGEALVWRGGLECAEGGKPKDTNSKALIVFDDIRSCEGLPVGLYDVCRKPGELSQSHLCQNLFCGSVKFMVAQGHGIITNQVVGLDVWFCGEHI